MENLPSLQQLLRQLQRVPYLASKNLYRVAHHFLEMNDAQFEQFVAILEQAHRTIIKCTTCWAWKEREAVCMLCAAPQRDKELLCVVETWHDLCALEKTGAFQGVYHVLGGAICPLDGVGPEDLTINHLLTRVEKQRCKEIILAMNQTPEGEATAAFIAKKLGVYKDNLKITCLSRGVPVGSVLDSMDRLTVFKALSERRVF